MTALLKIEVVPAFNAQSFDDAVRTATMRAQHSFFDQHVIEEEDGTYIAIDEGDYNALPTQLIDRIAHTVPGMMADDFDADKIDHAGAMLSILIDPEWDSEIPF